MAISPDDVGKLSLLLDEAEQVDRRHLPKWLEELRTGRRHLVPLLEQALAPSNAPSADWSLPSLDAASDACDEAGAAVGPYRLSRQIGNGGMGSVWLAERADGAYERRVALKLPRLASMPGLAERMARERQIGARLEHPNIARLYDAGVDAARRPYIAMEYVDGKAIDAWNAEGKRDIGELLRIFVQVIRAVAYAHRQLVVHRDLKPANVLVDAQGHAHLLDFGIATLVEETSGGASDVTQDHGRVFTRRYASPEQISGHAVGTASDIYSLGVTLYELLTGATPYVLARQTDGALEDAILQGAIAPPSTRVTDRRRRRRLRGDLDAILGKALEPKPEHRYASADAMADDIERHLAGLPVAVRRAPWSERLLRFVVRRRLGVSWAAAASVLVVLIAGGLALQARKAAEEAERTKTVTAFVEGMFRLQAWPPMVLPGSGTADGAVASVLDLIDARFGDRPDLQADLYEAVSRVYVDVGAGDLAAESAIRQLQALKRSGAPPDARAAAHMLLASANSLRGRYADAQKEVREAVRMLPDSNIDAGLEARALFARLLLTSGAHGEARAVFEAVDAATPVDRRPPSVALAKYLAVRASLLEIENQFDAAVALWNRAIALATRVEGANSRAAAGIRMYLAMEEMGRNRIAEARRDFDLAFGALRSHGDAGRIQAAVAATRFASMSFSMGLMPYADAKAMAEEAYATVAGWGRAIPRSVLAQIDVGRAVVSLRYQDLAAANRILEPATLIVRASTDGLIDRRWLATYLGALHMAMGHHDRAETWLRERLELRIRAGDGSTPYAAYDWVQLSQNALMKGDLAAAEEVLSRAPTFQALSGDLTANGQVYANAIAEQRVRIFLERGHVEAALAAMPAPYGLAPEEDRSEPTLATYALRGELLCAAGKPADGLPILLASIEAIAPVLYPAAPGLARLRALAGRCSLDLGKRAAASRLAALARDAFRQQPEVSAWYQMPLQQLERDLARH